MIRVRPLLIISVKFNVLILSFQDPGLNFVLFRKQIHVQIGSRCDSLHFVFFKIFLTTDV